MSSGGLAAGVEGRRFLRFLGVGLSNTAISFAAYSALIFLLPETPGMASIAQIVSYSVGIAWSYLWNRTLVFASRDRILGEGARFVVVQVGLMITSAAAIGLAVDGYGIGPLWAWVGVMAVVTLSNYLLLRLWAFRGVA